MRKKSCHIYVIAGTNGAGKSSILGQAFLQKGSQYFDPDEATKHILAANPHVTLMQANSAAWHEGRRLLERAIAERLYYAFETTLGGTTISALLETAAMSGIQVRIAYVGLASPELHMERVRKRVERGGHTVSEEKIRERYKKGPRNLIRLLPYQTELRLYDNSREADPHTGAIPIPIQVMHWKDRKIVSISPLNSVPDWAKPIVMTAIKLQAK